MERQIQELVERKLQATEPAVLPLAFWKARLDDE